MRAPLTPARHEDWPLPDGVPLHVRCWDGPRDLGIVFLHGIQSHGGWYRWSASLLAQTGHPVVMVDRRGSGRSGGPRGHADNAAQWTADLDAVIERARARLGFRSYAIVGVSWGGKLVVEQLRRRGTEIAAALLIAPGVFPGADVSFLEKFRIAGDLIRRPGESHDIPLSDPELFTDNPAGQAFIADDPLKLTQASARFLYESARLDARLRRLRDDSIATPTTMLLASDERIIQNAATRTWFERVFRAGRCVQLAGRHTLEFARDVTDFERELVGWRDSLNTVSMAPGGAGERR